MEEKLYSLAYELKELLSHDERITLLDSLEKELNKNEEVMALAYQKDLAATNYSDALNHFSENSEEVKKAQATLFEKKKALDNHPLVSEYLNAYSKVRDLYFEMNDILFSHLSIHLKECK